MAGGERELFSALSARGPVARELDDAAWLQALLDVPAPSTFRWPSWRPRWPGRATPCRRW